MSHFIIVAADMHKIAEFQINIKYRRPGNVVEYVPVEFEVFIDHRCYKAMPLQNAETRLLVNLPNELIFEIKSGKICNCKKGTEEIVEEIVSKLVEMDLLNMSEESLGESVINIDSPGACVHENDAAGVC